jgi:L-alanine-DL-glutamate epimerase-like enolase superfamily enzyme
MGARTDQHRRQRDRRAHLVEWRAGNRRCAAAHFACTYVAKQAHEMSSFLDAADHVADRDLVVEDGLLRLPDGPGIGLCLDPKKLARYRIDK